MTVSERDIWFIQKYRDLYICVFTDQGEFLPNKCVKFEPSIATIMAQEAAHLAGGEDADDERSLFLGPNRDYAFPNIGKLRLHW